MEHYTKSLIAAFAVLFVLSCGAPLKKADDVSAIFNNSEPLGLKVSNLCNILLQNQGAPNLQGVDLGLEACTRAGLQAQNFSLNGPIEFASTRADGQKFASEGAGVANKDNAFLRFQTRAEIWLGKSILSFISNLLPTMNDRSKGILAGGGGVNNAGGQQGMNLQILGEPTFDEKTFKFGLDLYIESLREQNGAVDIRNKFRVDGQLFDKKFIAATIVTTEDAPSERSLIHKGKFVILLVPHAQDMYIDVSIDITFHSFGVDAALKGEIQKILGDSLKTIIQQLDDPNAPVQPTTIGASGNAGQTPQGQTLGLKRIGGKK